MVVGLVVLLAEAAVRAFDLHDSVAAPSEALRALGEGFWSGELSGEVATTLGRYLQGLGLAVVGGVTLGVLLGRSRTLHDLCSAVIEFLRPIPAVVFIPVAIIFFGLGTPMIRSVVVYAAIWPIFVNTLYAVHGSDRLLHDVARTAGVRGPAELVHVTLPAALPGIATGIRVSAAVALIVCITAELVAGTNGIGAVMRTEQNAFRLPELYAAVVLVGLIGYALNLGLRLAQRRLLFWAGEERVAS